MAIYLHVIPQEEAKLSRARWFCPHCRRDSELRLYRFCNKLSLPEVSLRSKGSKRLHCFDAVEETRIPSGDTLY